VALLRHISPTPSAPRGSVVFVHGLSGDPFKTWQSSEAQASFWPAWLAADAADVAVYVLEYDAHASTWFGRTMQLPDRATDILAELASQNLDKVPITFVCHSLGGLLVKQVLRIAAEQHKPLGADIFKQTRGVVFLGTPNMGSHLANWTDRFRVLLRPSEATTGLAANDAYLRDLNIWYRDHCDGAGIATLVFFETKSTNGVMVVEAMSADPGLPGIRPIPVDSDHTGICKPASRDTTLYRSISRFVEESFQDSKLLHRNLVGEDRQTALENIDVFISHSSTQRDWVETLADNLQRAGKSVFLDLWRLVPGRDFIDGLRAGLAACRSAILVVSPEALQSGWVREEYEILKRRQAKDPKFTIVPIIHSEVDGKSPFFGSIQWVDFRDSTKHLESFARLLAGLEARAPGPNPSYDTRLWTPLPAVAVRPIAAAGQATIEQACSKLFNSPAVVILAQEGLGSSAISREIKRRAAEKFGEKATVQLTPSYVTPEDGPGPYFESLLAQIGLPSEAASPLTFQRRLAQRLDKGDPMCLLFTGIEQSPREALEKLCGALRALNEQYAHLRVLMCGGERLCEMRYAKGALSYLSHAQEELWPEPSPTDFQAEASALDCGVLSDDMVALLQELTGGHFGLLRELLALAKAGERNREGFLQAIIDSPTVWAAVAPLRDNEQANRSLTSIVGREDLGEAQRFIRDPILRRIYWLNLIARRRSGSRLQLGWRSPAIRDAVGRIVCGG
jgi:TIR domain/Putative serine esterase (DUF676)